jgi:3D (Asp-Asp-Asp) domain-containing protein
MASGKKAYVGAVACPRRFKLGTKVRIAGQLLTCEDRTAKRYDGRFDIFQGYGQQAYDKAITWGIRRVAVEIL